ncbi:hypothetical protein FACS189447_07800 [Spirochaetia bacterium]|nr:hypothetical protein FACS189447_07800 [Spirochaetia bacterium]
MAKFRKRVKIAPGVNLNFSKSGVSTTVGGKGASVNLGKNGAYLNTGIPGTGIYDRKKIGGGAGSASGGSAGAGAEPGAKIGALATFGGFLVLAGLVFFIGFMFSGSFWLKKLIAAAVFVLGFVFCILGGRDKPASGGSAGAAPEAEPPQVEK